MKKYVITVTRQFGSLGRPIAKKLSEKLNIAYYDRDLVEKAAEKLNLPVSKVTEEEELAKKTVKDSYKRMMFPLGKKSTDVQDKIFEAQENLIKQMVEKESCIIVGRCSDFILQDVEDSMHIYIYAPFEDRVKNCMEELKMEDDKKIRKMIVDVDEARAAYHKNYAGFLPDDKSHKDMLIDSSFLGVDGTVEMLAEIIKLKFGC